MNHNPRPLHHRAGPLFGVMLLVVTAALAFTPIVPPAIGAIDPTPAPSADVPTPTPDPAPDPTPTLDPTPTPTPDASPSPILSPTPTATADPSPSPDPSAEPSPDPSAEPSPSPSPTLAVVRGSLSLTADAPNVGRRRVDPGAVVTVNLAARVLDNAKDVRLVATIPADWGVTGAGGGTIDRDRGTVTWVEGNLEAGARVTETVRLRAPIRSPENRPAFDTVLGAELEHADGIADRASVQLRVAPEIVIEHMTFARVDEVNHTADYLAADTSLDGVNPYDVLRVRFQVRNADTIAVDLAPRLQYRVTGKTAYADVPLGDGALNVPFYVGAEWRPAGGGRGTLPGPDSEAIPATDLRVRDRDDEAQAPASGERLMGAKHAPTITLAGETYTEVEFTVKVTSALSLGQDFAFQLVNDGRAIPGAVVAPARSALQPALILSPGQRNGIPVGPPVDARPSPLSEVDFPLVTSAFWAAAWPESNSAPIYRLAVAVPTTPSTQYPLTAPPTSPHAPDTSLVSDTCAACHRSHVAQNADLLAKPAPQATMCFTCHDGSGLDSSLNTQAQYAGIPANDATTSKYYSHDAVTGPVAPNVHSLAHDNEFGGVSNRHSECADCHNSHNATTTPSTQLTSGWTVSGRQAAISGVSLANGAAGEAPTYTFLSGAVGSQPDREYQICFKCHSGFTTLPARDAAFPSTWALDKAIELNPANASYHPVEAKGTNATPQMAWSLANSSPYKQWNFTTGSTVRCVNCHGDPRKYNATLPLLGTNETSAGDDLAPHASQYRGILIQNYRDRVLKAPDEGYDGADFALCYVCHAEAPYRSHTPTNTVFDDHDRHVSTMAGKGPGGTSIDTPGQGGGNALCAECHFRTHSTAQAFNVDDRSNERLVNFAPNVEPNNGVLRFTKTATGGSCTLICHGKPHLNVSY